MQQFRFIPLTGNEVQRGNVVLVEDTGDVPQMVVCYSYRRGVQVAPYTGAINSRRRQRVAVARGAAPAPPEWGARWVKLADLTHVAAARRGW